MTSPAAARLPIHFDVPANYLSAADYIIALESFKTTLDEFNKRLFNGQLDYEFIAIGAEAGSYKGITGILVNGAAVATFIFATIQTLETDTGRGFVKGVIGSEIDYKQTGEDAGRFLRDLTVGFYSTVTDKLEKVIPASVNLDKALKAKNDFYTMCINNKAVSAVGFTDSTDFPIKRPVFTQHLSKEKIRYVASDFVLYDAIIVSPVDIDVDQVWRFQDRITKRGLNAYMRDDSYKQAFLNGRYPLKQSKQDDRVIVMLEYKKQEKNGEVEQKEVCVHTVYSFNDTEIVPLPKVQVMGVKFSHVTTLPMDDLWA
jgi:hypothetical protein